jgi:magnesium-transporting ATPase (P-type)
LWLHITGVVVFVGGKTEIGKIAARLADGGSGDKKTALTATMERLMYGLFFVGLIFGACLVRQSPVLHKNYFARIMAAPRVLFMLCTDLFVIGHNSCAHLLGFRVADF